VKFPRIGLSVLFGLAFLTTFSCGGAKSADDTSALTNAQEQVTPTRMGDIPSDYIPPKKRQELNASGGRWSTVGTRPSVIAWMKTDRDYRICNTEAVWVPSTANSLADAASNLLFIVKTDSFAFLSNRPRVYVDGKDTGELLPGNCRDVQGKKIDVRRGETLRTEHATGTYVRLDWGYKEVDTG
jgi:hypothetical protein